MTKIYSHNNEDTKEDNVSSTWGGEEYYKEFHRKNVCPVVIPSADKKRYSCLHLWSSLDLAGPKVYCWQPGKLKGASLQSLNPVPGKKV